MFRQCLCTEGSSFYTHLSLISVDHNAFKFHTSAKFFSATFEFERTSLFEFSSGSSPLMLLYQPKEKIASKRQVLNVGDPMVGCSLLRQQRTTMGCLDEREDRSLCYSTQCDMGCLDFRGECHAIA